VNGIFKEIKKNKKLYMLVVEQIQELIEEGKLKPGEKLPSERELSSQFGLSRSSIREALTALEIMGLLEIYSGLGTFVSKNVKNSATDNFDDLEDSVSPTEIVEARKIIEPQLAKLAAQRATKEDLEEIRANLEKAEALGNDNIEEFERLDEEFHLLIAKAAYNEVLYRFAESLKTLRSSKLWGNLKYKSLQKGNRVAKYKEEHKELYEALSTRNARQAELISKKHITDISNHLFDD